MIAANSGSFSVRLLLTRLYSAKFWSPGVTLMESPKVAAVHGRKIALDVRHFFGRRQDCGSQLFPYRSRQRLQNLAHAVPTKNARH